MKGQKPKEPVISVSPSQKKLKQARLPFMVLGDSSPTSEKVISRQRKLSATDNEDIKNKDDIEDTINISGDENQTVPDDKVKQLNPYVKLVDTVLKKKSRKSRPSKTVRGSKRNSKKPNETDSTNTSEQDKSNNYEIVNMEEKLDVEIINLEDTDNIKDVINNKLEIISPDVNDNTGNMDIDQSLPIEDGNLNHTTNVDDLNTTTDCDKSINELNDSIITSETEKSNPSTPIRVKLQSDKKDDSLNESLSNLTPKQQQRKLESIKRREEREKEKTEREKKRQQEKEERDKVKKEKEDQKKKEREEKEELKKKEREEKEEQKKKEKEEKEKQKELEKKLREEKEEQKKREREEKEEQRRKEKEAKDLERKKKQEALELEKQEQELKKKKAAEAFVNFFVPKQKNDKDVYQSCTGPISNNNMLSTFAVKSDMRLAPNTRVKFTDDRKTVLDGQLDKQKCSVLYLKCLKSDEYKPETRGKTWPLEDKDDCIIVEDELPPLDCAGEVISCESAVRERLRPKLLSFHENRRPPYWGTWRKKSQVVTPRKPFGQDQKVLEYEVDSDDEWEEEQEGESISGSAAGSDVEPEDDYELDNKVFVPHGYLSDEEGTMDGDDMLSLSPETQKARLKLLEDEFESELKKPTEKLKPRLYGLIWETSDGGKPDNCVDALWNYFQKLTMIMEDPTPFFKPASEPEDAEKKKTKKRKLAEGEQQSPKSEKKKKPKTESKENKPKTETKKKSIEVKNQRGINSFLTKIKST